MRFNAEDLALFPNLKVIVRMGVGYDRLDRVALAERNVTVCNVPDYGTCEIADHALALALSLRRGVLLHHEHQRGETPAPWMYIESPLVQRLQQHTFGILGLGRIGKAAALRAKALAGMFCSMIHISRMGLTRRWGWRGHEILRSCLGGVRR